MLPSFFRKHGGELILKRYLSGEQTGRFIGESLTKRLLIPEDKSKPLGVCVFADLEEALGGSVERFAFSRPDASLIQLESALILMHRLTEEKH